MDAMGPPPEKPEEERVDGLRRRLYQPGASAADIAAYRTAADLREEPVRRPVAGPAVPGGRRSRGVGAGVGAVLLVVGLLALIQLRPLGADTERPRPTAMETATATATPTATETATDTETVARVPASTPVRDAFVNALRRGRDAGLLLYFYEHPESRPPAIRTLSRAASDEYSGRGTSTITLDPSALAEHGGRFTVVVLLDRDGPFTWRAERIDPLHDRSGPVVPVVSQSGSARAGEPISATKGYTGAAPTRLAVVVAESVRWDVAVVFSD